MKKSFFIGLCALMAAVMSSCGPKEPTPGNENKNWEPLDIKMAELPKLCQSLLQHDTAEVLWQMSNAGFKVDFKRYGEVELSKGALRMIFYSEGGKMIETGFSVQALYNDSLISYWRDWEEQAYTYSTWIEWTVMGYYNDPDKGPQHIQTPYRDEWLEIVEKTRGDESVLMFEIVGQNKTKYYGLMMDIDKTTNETSITYQVGEEK